MVQPLLRADPSRPSVREIPAAFEAMLLQAAFAPLAKAIGFYGETVVSVATESMLRERSDGVR
jgi:hypothetical protein